MIDTFNNLTTQMTIQAPVCKHQVLPSFISFSQAFYLSHSPQPNIVFSQYVLCNPLKAAACSVFVSQVKHVNPSKSLGHDSSRRCCVHAAAGAWERARRPWGLVTSTQPSAGGCSFGRRAQQLHCLKRKSVSVISSRTRRVRGAIVLLRGNVNPWCSNIHQIAAERTAPCPANIQLMKLAVPLHCSIPDLCASSTKFTCRIILLFSMCVHLQQEGSFFCSPLFSC